MSYNATWSDPDNHQTNLESGDVLYEGTIREGWMNVLKWLGTEHVHRGRDGDGPQWPTASISDHKTWTFYNSVAWNGPDQDEPLNIQNPPPGP